MELDIENRVAMVLAAGGGLGSAIAESLADEGAKVVGCDVDVEALQEVVRRVNNAGGSMIAEIFDLSDLSACDAAVDSIESRIGPVEILVNITGGPPAGTASGQSAGEWGEHFDAMVAPVIHLTDRVIPQMREKRWGRIITSTSSGVVAPIPNLGFSNTLRSALVGWSKTLAGEVATDGVTVNVIVPGRIETSRIQQLNEAKAKREDRTVEEVSNESTATIPVGRYGEPGEYADVVTFVSSERASFVNGCMIRVDGGMIRSV